MAKRIAFFTLCTLLVLVVILYLGGEVVDAVTRQDSVSQLTHIVGGLCGAGLGLLMKR